MLTSLLLVSLLLLDIACGFSHSCKWKDPSSGASFDLSSLPRKHADYVSTNPGFKYFMNVSFAPEMQLVRMNACRFVPILYWCLRVVIRHIVPRLIKYVVEWIDGDSDLIARCPNKMASMLVNATDWAQHHNPRGI